MKVYLHDDFTAGSININKWDVIGTISVESSEAVIEETTQPGNVAVGGMLTTKVHVPPSFSMRFDHRFITNTNLQSGTGFWSTDSIFFRKTNPDWTQGENNQLYITYHVDTDQIVEVIVHLTHRSPTGVVDLGQVNIPLDMLESLDIEGTGAVLRDLHIVVHGKKIVLKVGDTVIDEFEDSSPLHSHSSIQFGTNSPLDLTTKFSITNVLVTSA